MATKKTIKKIDEVTKLVEEEKPITEEDRILGEVPAKKIKKQFEYESPKVLYKVTNLILKNNPITVKGTNIETFIGSSNVEARKQLLNGVKSVITYNGDKKEHYKIEVIG